MYRYDEFDHRFVEERVAEFSDQVARRLSGELSEDQFKPLRLMNGVYLQLHAYMLRIAIPYGTLSSRQMRSSPHRGARPRFGHFRCRTSFNGAAEDVPDILQIWRRRMHAIQTSGNCIRNVTADHFAGIAPDEIDDPRPYCEIIRQWSTLHPEFTYLPRKFKIAVTGSPADRAASEVHDIGLHMKRDASGNVGFEVLVGGGLGRTPMIGKVIREFLPREHLLSYLEAILRIYNLEGRRDNIYKARIKILVKARGIGEFRTEVEAEWKRIRDSALRLDVAEIDRVRAFFAPPPYEKLPDADVTQGQGPQFRAWYRYNTRPHRVPGYRAVIVSLKKHGEAPGDMTAAQMESLADLADRVSSGQVRVTHDQNLVLGEVRQIDLLETWKELDAMSLATPNIGTLTDIICCPGLDFCSLANAGSIGIAKQIHERFNDFDYLYDLGHVEIKMSGCMNACGHHHVGHIGILGVEKRGEEWYQITIGGSASGISSLGEVIGPSVAKTEVAETIARLLDVYVAQREEGEEFLGTVRRIGVAPFREKVYGAAH
jgi:sulfite reductase (NADPH) hemoprotein beta-component